MAPVFAQGGSKAAGMVSPGPPRGAVRAGSRRPGAARRRDGRESLDSTGPLRAPSGRQARLCTRRVSCLRGGAASHCALGLRWRAVPGTPPSPGSVSSAGIAQRQSPGLPSQLCGFDSRCPLCAPRACADMQRTLNPRNGVRFPGGALDGSHRAVPGDHVPSDETMRDPAAVTVPPRGTGPGGQAGNQGGARRRGRSPFSSRSCALVRGPALPAGAGSRALCRADAPGGRAAALKRPWTRVRVPLRPLFSLGYGVTGIPPASGAGDSGFESWYPSGLHGVRARPGAGCLRQAAEHGEASPPGRRG